MSKAEIESKILYWYGIILILEIGLLHIMTAQGEYEEAAYMGYLFAANFFGSLIAAFGIYHKQFWGWMLGLLIAAGSIAGYIWSRTFGMPEMNVEEWFSPYGLVSMSVETAFVFLVLIRPWSTPVVALKVNTKSGYAFTILGLFVILAIGGLTYQWDAAVTKAYGPHVGSLDQVCSTPVTSLAELEEKYGVQISLVAESMMNGIVDVRIKIVDVEKANSLLQNQAALLVGQEALILAPHMHSHSAGRLKIGKMFIIFFPTQQLIHRGSEVSLIFGPIRVESVPVR